MSATISSPPPADEPMPSPALKEATSFARDAANLDFLRAFAVLCVFVRHILSEYGDPTRSWLQPQAIGIFGVMAFFVHTSLVLMLSLERQVKTAKPGFSGVYFSFLVRRAFRVYPLSTIVILVAWFVLPPAASHTAEFIQNGTYTLATLFANLSLTNNLNGFPYVIGTLWTLPLELQMYLFLPFLFLLARKWPASRLLAAWPVVAAIAFVCRYKLNLPEVFGYLPCFFSGVLAYRLGRGKLVLPFWLLPVAMVTILVGYMVLYGRFRAQTPLGWGVCLSLAILLCYLKPVQQPWLKTASKWVATYSYGIYLTHTFAIYAAFSALPLQGVARIAVAAVLTGVFSVAVFHLIEAPMIVVGGKVARLIDARRRLTLDEAPAP